MKKLIAFGLALVLALSAVGCNCQFIVEPTEDSWELNSADRIEVPIEKMPPSTAAQIVDILEVVYKGEILETSPARLTDIQSIKIAENDKEEKCAVIPMVMVDGTLYLDTGFESTVETRCGVMDGEITSTVDGSEVPTENNQSNFGTGYGYQYGPVEGTVEIFMDDQWRVYATQ